MTEPVFRATGATTWLHKTTGGPRRRWLTPAEWVRTRKLMRRNARENQSVCGACGTYLTYGYHWHYIFRWVSGWRTW